MVGLATESEARLLFRDAIRFLTESLGAEGGLALYGRQRMDVQASHRLTLSTIKGEAILNQVRSEGSPLLGKAGSVLCVPFFEPGSKRVLGVLYAERPDPQRPFNKHHMQRLVDFVRNLENCLFRSTPGSDGTLAFRKAKAVAQEVATQSGTIQTTWKTKKTSSGPLKHRSLSIFFRSLATMVDAGVPLHRAVGLMGSTGEDPAMRSACSFVEQELLEGKPLSFALQSSGKFTIFEVQLIRTGEKSGALPSVLGHLADYRERSESSALKLKSALTYPAIIFLIALTILLLAPPFLLRGQLEMIQNSGAQLPLVTKALIFLSDLLISPTFWIPAGAILGLGTLALSKSLKTRSGRRKAQLILQGMPVIGQVLDTFYTSRFALSLSIQLKAGVLWTKALPLAASSSGSAILEDQIKLSTAALREGQTPSESLAGSASIPDLLVELVQVGQETGTPGELMEWVSEFYEKELESALERLVALLEPLVMLGMGVMVGLILMGTLLPMISVINLL